MTGYHRAEMVACRVLACLTKLKSASRTIGIPAREDNGYGFAMSIGKTAEKAIDRCSLPALFFEFLYIEMTIRYRNLTIGRHHIHMVRVNGDPLGNLFDRHLRPGLQQLCHMTFMFRGEDA